MTAPRATHTDSRIVQLFNALASFIDSLISPLQVNTATVIRVDTLGADAGPNIGLRGRFDRPFATVAAAMAVALDGDTILIGEGTWNELITIPAARTSLHIQGAGILNTIIDNSAAGAAALTWTAAGVVMTNMSISDISFIGNTAAPSAAVVFNGTALNTCFASGLLLSQVRASNTGAGGSFYFTSINVVQMNNCRASTGDACVFTKVSSAVVLDCNFGGALTFSYNDVGGTDPSGGRLVKYVYNSTFASLGVSDIESVVCDSSCLCNGAAAATLIDGAGLGHVGTNGLFEYHGTITGACTITFFVGAPRVVATMDRCKIVGAFSAIDTTGGAANVGTVNLRNAVLSAALAGNITSNSNAFLDMIGAQFNHTAGVLLSANATGAPAVAGTVNRSVHREALALTLPGPDVVAFAVPFADANYTVIYETTVALTDVLTNPKAGTGFTAQSAAADAAASFVVIHE